MFPAKSFFYSTSDDFNFKPIPKLEPLFGKKVDQLVENFEGNPKKQLFEVVHVKIIPAQLKVMKVQEEEPVPEENAEQAPINPDVLNDEIQPAENENVEELEKPVEEYEPEKREEVTLVCREIDRLAFIVRAIEWDCSIVPRGSLRLNINHQIFYDNSFKGLNSNELLQPESWLHFRSSENEDILNKLDQPNVIFDKDILDSIKYDQPRNSWSIQINPSKEYVC